MKRELHWIAYVVMRIGCLACTGCLICHSFMIWQVHSASLLIGLFLSFLELDEFTPLYPRQPTLEYSMQWFSESESPKQTKSWCKSPRQRLKRLGVDIDNMRRITTTNTRTMQQADKVTVLLWMLNNILYIVLNHIYCFKPINIVAYQICVGLLVPL